MAGLRRKRFEFDLVVVGMKEGSFWNEMSL